MAKTFIDTNVVVYANDARDRAKQAAAIDAVAELMETGRGVVSTQVLQEYAATALSKLRQPIEAVLSQLTLLETLEVVVVTPEVIRRAVEMQQRYKLSFWDAGILAAAEHAKCERVLSENFSPYQRYGTLRVENPLA